MSAIDDITASLPIDQLAAELGERPEDVRSAVAVALPALLQGLGANAQDPGGAASLTAAVQQHQDGLADGPVDLGQVNVADGERITRHVFGDNTDQVVSALGGVGGSGGLIGKLLPILAPIVLSYLAKQMGSGGGGGVLESILGQILGGAAQGSGGGSAGMGSMLDDLLGGLLGGGTRA